MLVMDPDMIIRDSFADWGRVYGAGERRPALPGSVWGPWFFRTVALHTQATSACGVQAVVVALVRRYGGPVQRQPRLPRPMPPVHGPPCRPHPADRGWAVSLYFGYMRGVANNLSATHVPEVQPRTDGLAGG